MQKDKYKFSGIKVLPSEIKDSLSIKDLDKIQITQNIFI